jgi:hypothetical protein
MLFFVAFWHVWSGAIVVKRHSLYERGICGGEVIQNRIHQEARIGGRIR